MKKSLAEDRKDRQLPDKEQSRQMQSSSSIDQDVKAKLDIKLLLDNVPEAIMVYGMDDRIEYWNQGAQQVYAYRAEEVIGKTVQEIRLSSLIPKIESAMKHVLENGSWNGELAQRTRDNREVIVRSDWKVIRDQSGKPALILVVDTDITDLKRLESQLLRAQRLESIGALAGGIAHDLNNILAPILMAMQCIQETSTDPRFLRWVQIVQDNVKRGSDLVTQMLAFAKGVKGDRTSISIGRLIRDLSNLLRGTFPKSIQIRSSYPKDLWMINGNATRIYQVLMNLCVNARDAMPDGGVLEITAANKVLDKTWAGMREGAHMGPYVMITVTDNGTGIAHENLNRIFEPFFSTKTSDQGTGLGLSTALMIVESHNGFIDVQSAPDQGSRFDVYIPAIQSNETRQAEIDNSVLPDGNGELILLVDDEKAILEITSAVLEAHSFRTITANNGADAVAQCVKHVGEINVALINLSMLPIDGAATAQALRIVDPKLKIIIDSGLDEVTARTTAMGAGADAFLSKPFTARLLIDTILSLIKARQGDN